MRKWVTIAFASILCLVFGGVALANNWGTYCGYPIARVKLDRTEVKPTAPAIVVEGSTYVPLQFIHNQLGHEVSWDKETSTINIRYARQPVGIPPAEPSVGTNLPLSDEKDGIKITLDRVGASSSNTTLHFSVENNSDRSIKLWEVWAVTGITLLPWDSYDFIELRPGVIKEREYLFGPLPSMDWPIWVYYQIVDSGTYDILLDGVFTVELTK